MVDPDPVNAQEVAIPWPRIIWPAALMLACFAPVFYSLVEEWAINADMGHGFFVPVISAYIAWQRREEVLACEFRPHWLGPVLVALGGLQLIVATLGVELFLSRTAITILVIGIVLWFGGIEVFRKLMLPLLLLFFMVPLPAIIYNRLTFPLQILASRLAETVLQVLDVPVLREGNVLELPQRSLSVVEACSGIRSLLSLTFLSLVYGYFFEKRMWLRVVLFLLTIPIAIASNGGRVTLTGILSQIRPELAEGFFHESTGWVIFMIALGMMVVAHQTLARSAAFIEKRRAAQ